MGPLGWQETVFIFLLALLIFGPKKLPELGKTAAKAYLGMLNCHLALGQEDKGREALEALAQYDDSYVIQGPNQLKRTFYDIGCDLLEEYEAGGVTEVSEN